MAYATQQDISDIYSDDALYVADRNGDGIVDDVAVERALESASNEIDSYIGVRYSLPLSNKPASLRQPCVDIALYRLATSRDVLSDEHRRRYDDALKFLTNISNGRATLNLPDPDGSGETAGASTPPNPIISKGPKRLFGRSNAQVG